jgi:hypothetical protein
MSRNVVFGIVIALSIATFAATIVVSYSALKVEAVETDKWCYTHDIVRIESVCFQTKNSCVDAHDADEASSSNCSTISTLKLKP